MPDSQETGFFAKVGAWHRKGVVTNRCLNREEAYTVSGQNNQLRCLLCEDVRLQLLTHRHLLDGAQLSLHPQIN